MRTAGNGLYPARAVRLAGYMRVAMRLVQEGRDCVTSRELGDYVGVNPMQVRRDLAAVEFAGTPEVGYQTGALVEAAREVLGSQESRGVILVGAGWLGRAIAASDLLYERGFVVRDVFDNDPGKIGRTLGALTVRHVDELGKAVPEDGGTIGVIATPASAAREVAGAMVEAGIRTIIDYTGALPRLPEEVRVYRADPTARLVHTLYYLTRTQDADLRTEGWFR